MAFVPSCLSNSRRLAQQVASNKYPRFPICMPLEAPSLPLHFQPSDWRRNWVKEIQSQTHSSWPPSSSRLSNSCPCSQFGKSTRRPSSVLLCRLKTGSATAFFGSVFILPSKAESFWLFWDCLLGMPGAMHCCRYYQCKRCSHCNWGASRWRHVTISSRPILDN